MKYDFLDSAVLARLGAIPLDARAAMIGNVAGRHKSPHRGSSVEFAEYRKYVQGDDTRRLDWKAYARSDRYYIKEFEADTNLRAYMVMDSSGSMNFFSEEHLPKIDYAKRLAAALCYLIVNQGDAAGLACCNDKLQIEIPPARRASHLQNVFKTIDELKPQGETGLVDALHSIAEKAGRRALIVIFSDLFTDPNDLADALQHLRYRKHDVAIFHLLDQQEIDFTFDRPHRFVDMEDNTTLVVEPNLIADEYQKALAEYLTEIQNICNDATVDYRRLVTTDDYENILRNFLSDRMKKK